MNKTTKRVVIVTGACAGIGAATANLLRQKGFTVYGIDRKSVQNSEFPIFTADITDSDAVAAIFEEIFKREGQIDALVNNAGIGISGALEDADIEHIRAIVNVNLIATSVCSKLIIPYLRRSKGRIVNMGSVGGAVPLPYQAMYSATKAAIEAFSRALNTEVRAFGMRVTCVMPGDTRTEFTDSRIKDGQSGENAAKAQKFIGKMERDERNGMPPSRVAKAVCKSLVAKRRIVKITVGVKYKFVVFLAKILPAKAVDWIVGKVYG